MPDIPEPRLLGRTDTYVVIHKPSGVAAHPGTGDAPDLVTWLDAHRETRGCRPVHRLDLHTSGVVLAAASPSDRAFLGDLFASREVSKHYVALVIGRARPKGIIQRKLQDARRGEPLEAITRYTRREALGGFSLVDVHPVTGRKHQIRRHFQGIGLPLVGDTRYGPKKPVRVPAYPGRLCLHAHRLELPDGTIWTSPLPDAIIACIEALRAGNA